MKDPITTFGRLHLVQEIVLQEKREIAPVKIKNKIY